MKAIVQTGYGSPDDFELRNVEKSAIRRPNQVLVRVHAASLHAGDVFMMRGVPYFTRLVVGLPRPRGYIPGYDVSGTVESVGSDVSRFRPGDEVYGSLSRSFAEYVSTPHTNLAHKPRGLSMEQAAAVPTSAIAALQGIRDAGRVKPGHKVLINGASGGVGTYAVQIAKAYGAEVTGVCSTRNIDRIRSIGADHVIDYRQEDFTRGSRRYDLILDNVANHPLSACRRVLSRTGLHVPNSGHSGMPYIIKALFVSLFVRGQGRAYVATIKPGDLEELRNLIESDKIRPVIDRLYSLSEFSDAMRYLNEGHVQGKIAIRIHP